MSNKKMKRSKEKIEVWDIIHLVLCVAVCIMTVLVFVDMNQFLFLFPLVFACAGLMNLTTAMRMFAADKNGKRNIPGMVVFLVFAAGLFVVAYVGARVCW